MTNKERSIGFLAPIGSSARDAELANFISTALYLPGNALGYHVSERLTALFPQRALVETRDGDFDLEGYARVGHCALAPKTPPHGQRTLYWPRTENRVDDQALNVWFTVVWQGHDLEVLVMHWGDEQRFFILAGAREVAERFFRAVCAWTATELDDEVLVFDGGHWDKDEDLFTAIKSARFDNLVLRSGLKEEILRDVTRFFAARSTYEGFGVPWKRGILFAGPPGNGKTHAVKALVNATGKPCLYVKGFHQRQSPDEYGMRAVFERARASAPCILVLEDLDALVTDRNRSFFLNEMDGFAANGGILTLATTNHPERLDAAIVHRPSRFDRTYRFDLPALAERAAYVVGWNNSLRPAMRLDDAAVARVAQQTGDFSFAYLKELFLSATMGWMETSRPSGMATVVDEQVGVLRAQMFDTPALTATDVPGAESDIDDDESDGADADGALERAMFTTGAR